MSDLEFIRLLRSYIQFERIMIYPAERSDYKQILKKYYSGVKIEKSYNIDY